MSKKLYRVEENKKIFGVCGGIAEYLNADPTVVRALWVIFTLLICGTGFLIYFICALVFPNKSEVMKEINDNSNNESK